VLEVAGNVAETSVWPLLVWPLNFSSIHFYLIVYSLVSYVEYLPYLFPHCLELYIYLWYLPTNDKFSSHSQESQHLQIQIHVTGR
jgi:hypothetical protein